MSKRTAPQQWKKKKVIKKKPHKDPLDRWALEPGFKGNLKRCDQSLSVNFVTNTSLASSLLSTIPQGVGDNSRVGQRVRYHNWQVRGFVEFAPAATGAVPPDYLRVIFFYDRQTNNGSPLWSDLIANIASGGHTSFDPPNWYQRGRFKIIRDFKIAVPSGTVTVAGGLITAASFAPIPSPTSTEFQIDFFKALKGKIDAEWSGTGSTATNMNGGGLFVAAQNGIGTGFYTLTLTSTIEFTDV